MCVSFDGYWRERGTYKDNGDGCEHHQCLSLLVCLLGLHVGCPRLRSVGLFLLQVQEVIELTPELDSAHSPSTKYGCIPL